MSDGEYKARVAHTEHKQERIIIILWHLDHYFSCGGRSEAPLRLANRRWHLRHTTRVAEIIGQVVCDKKQSEEVFPLLLQELIAGAREQGKNSVVE